MSNVAIFHQAIPWRVATQVERPALMRGIVGSNLTEGYSFKISSDSIFFLKSPCLPMPIIFKN